MGAEWKWDMVAWRGIMGRKTGSVIAAAGSIMTMAATLRKAQPEEH